MRHLLLTVLGSLTLLPALEASPPADPPEGKTFELEEGKASRFRVLGLALRRGGRVEAHEEPPSGLRGSPPFVAETPLYGAFPLGTPGDADRQLFFALDKRKVDGRRYDRIYLDLDLDGDLSDEECRRTWEAFELEVDLDERLGRCSTELKPKLRSPRDKPATLTLYHTRVRHGRVEIGGREYEVVLSRGASLTGGFDRPECSMVLDPRSELPGEDQLGSGRLIDGKYWVFSATPDGSRLTVTPYSGKRGVFRVGAGGRDVDELSASGFLLGDFDAPIGELDEKGGSDPVVECSLPVGGYRPYYLTVRFGSSTLDVSPDPYSARESGSSAEHPIEIREDRPYVLDFSDRPEISFITPEVEKRIERGDELRVEALLTYPKLGVMISDIERWREGTGSGSWKRPTSINPKITVVDSGGEVRAKGNMPFG